MGEDSVVGAFSWQPNMTESEMIQINQEIDKMLCYQKVTFGEGVNRVKKWIVVEPVHGCPSCEGLANDYC